MAFLTFIGTKNDSDKSTVVLLQKIFRDLCIIFNPWQTNNQITIAINTFGLRRHSQ